MSVEVHDESCHFKLGPLLFAETGASYFINDFLTFFGFLFVQLLQFVELIELFKIILQVQFGILDLYLTQVFQRLH